MENNIKESSEKFEEYKEGKFTSDGYIAFNQYLVTLVEFYYNKSEEDYPFDMGFVLGVPNFKWASEVKNKDELYGRIKLIAQILGIYKMELKVGDSVVTHSFEVIKNRN